MKSECVSVCVCESESEKEGERLHVSSSCHFSTILSFDATFILQTNAYDLMMR